MFRKSADTTLDPKLEQLSAEVSREVFGPPEDIHQLDFATIEQRAHEVGRKVAQRLARDAAAQQAQTADTPQPCPDCHRDSPGAVRSRPFLIQDGSISLPEAAHFCSHCRRAFFPQSTTPTAQPSLL